MKCASLALSKFCVESKFEKKTLLGGLLRLVVLRGSPASCFASCSLAMADQIDPKLLQPQRRPNQPSVAELLNRDQPQQALD